MICQVMELYSENQPLLSNSLFALARLSNKHPVNNNFIAACQVTYIYLRCDCASLCCQLACIGEDKMLALGLCLCCDILCCDVLCCDVLCCDVL